MGSGSAIRRVLGSATALSAAFLVEHRGVLSLIDTGSRGCGHRILAAIRAIERRPEDVRQILLTHCHGDHTGEAARLTKLTGATIVAGTADVPVIEGIGDYPAPKDPLSRALFGSLERFARVAVDRPISGREELEGGLVAIPAPGHTLGHIAVLAPDLSALFVGDAVWHLGPLRPSWRRFTVDPDRNVESLKELAALRSGRVLLGHGPSVSGERLRRLAVGL